MCALVRQVQGLQVPGKQWGPGQKGEGNGVLDHFIHNVSKVWHLIIMILSVNIRLF